MRLYVLDMEHAQHMTHVLVHLDIQDQNVKYTPAMAPILNPALSVIMEMEPVRPLIHVIAQSTISVTIVQ